jgi:hypothetical protein
MKHPYISCPGTQEVKLIFRSRHCNVQAIKSVHASVKVVRIYKSSGVTRNRKNGKIRRKKLILIIMVTILVVIAFVRGFITIPAVNIACDLTTIIVGWIISYLSRERLFEWPKHKKK